MSQDQALQQLNRFSTDEALALLASVEAKRRKEHFVKYWEPTKPQVGVLGQFDAGTKILGVLGGNRCLSATECVLVPGGTKAIQDVRPGDTVYAGDGTPTRVLEVYENGPKPVFRFCGSAGLTEIFIDATWDHKVLSATRKDSSPKLRSLGHIWPKGYVVRVDGTFVPLRKPKFLGVLATYDLLVEHPSHTFLTGSLVPVSNSGKSEVGAAIAAAWALGKDYFRGEPAWSWVEALPIPEPPNVIWVVGLDNNVIQRVLWDEKLFRGRTHPGFIPPSEVERVSDRDRICELKNGSMIAGLSAESGREKFQSASVDLIWIDEEPEEEIFDECYQRTVDCAGRILLTLTPLTDIASGSRTPWVFNLHEEARADTKFAGLSVLDNPYIPTEELEKLKDKWAGHPEEKARLYGEFYQRSGLVYNLYAPVTHLIEPRRLPAGWKTVVCIDPAPTGITAALWAKADSFGNLYFFREYYESNLIVSAHAKNILVRNQGQPVDLWLIDPKGGSQRNAETHKSIAQLYREAGIPVRLAEVGEDFGLGESQEFIAAALSPTSRHPKAQFFNDLENFKYEIARYSWATVSKGERKGLTTEKPIKRNDHLMNCFQYICALRPKARSGSESVRVAPHNSYT